MFWGYIRLSRSLGVLQHLVVLPALLHEYWQHMKCPNTL